MLLILGSAHGRAWWRFDGVWCSVRRVCYYVTDTRRAHARGDSFTFPCAFSSEDRSPQHTVCFVLSVITHRTIGRSRASWSLLSTAGATNEYFKTALVMEKEEL